MDARHAAIMGREWLTGPKLYVCQIRCKDGRPFKEWTDYYSNPFKGSVVNVHERNLVGSPLLESRIVFRQSLDTIINDDKENQGV